MKNISRVLSIVPGGALSFDGKQWNSANEKFLFSSKALAKRFKKRYIDALKSMYENGELEFFGTAVSMRSKEMTLDADEFIRRFLLHVLPERFVKIRYFGFLSHRVKKESVERIRNLADPDFKPPEKREETAEETMTRLIGEDICLCPKCRKGHMAKVLELSKPKIMPRRVRIVVIDSS